MNGLQEEHWFVAVFGGIRLRVSGSVTKAMYGLYAGYVLAMGWLLLPRLIGSTSGAIAST